MRHRYVIFLGLIVAIFGGAWAHAVELLGQPQVTSAATSAIITWKTDVACGTRLQYGLSEARMAQKLEGPVSATHEVRLEALAPGTTYYYSVGSARVQLASGAFTTTGAAPSATPQPSLARRILNAITPAPKAAPTATVPPPPQTWNNVATLRDHFVRHGPDFGSKTPNEYAAGAWLLLQRARAENLPMKLDDTDGTLRIFDPSTNAFAAYTSAGKTKTYFKPGSPGYWQSQPGRLVKSAADLPATFRQQ